MSSDATGKTALAILSARENIRLIRLWAEGRDLAALKQHTLVRYAIERAFIGIDAAVKDIAPSPLDAALADMLDTL